MIRALKVNNLLMHYRWEGEGVSEVGKNKATGDVLVRVNPRFYRPTEVVSTFGLMPDPIVHLVGSLIPVGPYTFMEIDREIFSTVILLLSLIQEGLLSFTRESMCCTEYWLTTLSRACPGKKLG